MAFDMSRVALGFAGGALSGYDTMLKAKMQEEYQQKREEAMYNRQKNLMEYQAKINQTWETDPNNPDTQVKKQNILASQASIKHQDRTFALQEKEYQTNTQFKSAELGLRQQALSIEASRTAALNAASAASAKSSGLQAQIAQLQLEAITNPDAANERVATAYSNQIAKSGATPEEVEAAKNLVRQSGATSFSDLATLQTNNKEVLKEAQKVKAEAIKKADEELGKLEPTDWIERWAKIAPGSATKDPMEAKQNLLRTSGETAFVSFLGSSTSSSVAEKNPATTEASKKNFTISKMASDASKILATPEQDRTEEDKKVLEIIRTEVNALPKEEQVKFNSMVQIPSWIKETAPFKNLAEQRRRAKSAEEKRKKMLEESKARELKARGLY
jgi:hypothetical protein